MTVNEIIDKIKFAIEMCGDGGNDPFSDEEREEMFNFLNAHKLRENGHNTWSRGEKPRWKEGDILAYYEYTSDYEGEHVLGEIVNVTLDEDFCDWLYEFNDGSADYEENLVNHYECYTISQEYYDKHFK